MPYKTIMPRGASKFKVATRGHELISRVLKAPTQLGSFHQFTRAPSMHEIACYLRAIRGGPDDRWGAFVNESCGFHVHVARVPDAANEDAQIPLPVLQHLAYILVQYEDLISSLHPPSRRGLALNKTYVMPYVGSNLMGLRRSAHTCHRQQVDLEKARKKIFAHNMTIRRLGLVMDTEIQPELHADAEKELKNGPSENGKHYKTVLDTGYKFVNFDRMDNPSYSLQEDPTLEFRQHKGTLDFEEIAHWVHFVLSLVRAAERMAVIGDPKAPASKDAKSTNGHETSAFKQETAERGLSFSTREGQKYKLRPGKLSEQFRQLFDLLDFDKPTRKYWIQKWAEANNDEIVTVRSNDANNTKRIVSTRGECIICRVADDPEYMAKSPSEDLFAFLADLRAGCAQPS
jgi:hypothetical protein